MRTFEEMQRLWSESPPPHRGRGTVRLICVRVDDGVHECPPRVTINEELDVVGDRWIHKVPRKPGSQVTLMSVRVAEIVAADHAPLHAAGDNFLVDLDVGEEAMPVGTQVRLGDALVEVSADPHLGCKKFTNRFGADATRWVNEEASRPLRLRGVNCRVVRGGEVALGQVVEVVTR